MNSSTFVPAEEEISHTCLLLQFPFETFAVPFQNTRAISFFHSKIPRYGHTNNITKLMTPNDELSGGEKQDYVAGLFLTSITVVFIFVAWMLCLAIMRRLGPRQVGGWSGRLAPVTPKPIVDSPELEEWNLEYHQRRQQLFHAKVGVIFAGCCIIIATIILSTKGVQSLVNTLESGQTGMQEAQRLTQDGIGLINKVILGEQSTQEDIEFLLLATNQICPAVHDSLCNNISNIETCDFGDNLQILGGDDLIRFIQHFGSLKTELYDELARSRTDIENLQAVAEDMESTMASFNWAFQVARIFALLLAVFCVLIIAGVASNAYSLVTTLRHWIAIPIFVALVFLSFFFSVIFVLGSIVLADVCMDSPDTELTILLDRFRSIFPPFLFSFLLFYAQQCPVSSIPQALTNGLDYLSLSIQYLQTIGDIWTSQEPDLLNKCGLDSPLSVIALAQRTSGQICGLAQSLQEVQAFFQCSNVFPLYSFLAHDTMCYKGTAGFAWISVSQWVVVFMAMVVLTCRMAFQELEFIPDDLVLMIEEEEETSWTNRTMAAGNDYVVQPERESLPQEDGVNSSGSELAHCT